MIWHTLLNWHNPDWRITIRNKDGSISKINCAKCTCPKEALGYSCQHRTIFSENSVRIECGNWEDFEAYDAGYDGPVVGHRGGRFQAHE